MKSSDTHELETFGGQFENLQTALCIIYDNYQKKKKKWQNVMRVHWSFFVLLKISLAYDLEKLWEIIITT